MRILQVQQKVDTMMVQQRGKKQVQKSLDNPSILLNSTCDITRVVLDATLQAFMRLTKLLVDV